jgi:phage/plasmid primase-like uncharacterized protein
MRYLLVPTELYTQSRSVLEAGAEIPDRTYRHQASNILLGSRAPSKAASKRSQLANIIYSWYAVATLTSDAITHNECTPALSIEEIAGAQNTMVAVWAGAALFFMSVLQY